MSEQHGKPDKKRQGDGRSYRVSKGLSWLLRHGAPKENIKIYPGGFADMDDVLKHKRLKGVTVEEVKEIVEKNDKQRFTLKIDEERGKLQICANQGHSFEVETPELIPVLDSTLYPTVIHGTYLKNWESIQKNGLSRMTRCHIHFAIGERGDKSVISGMRNSVEIYIYIDLEKALKDGLKFFISKNNVILCPGNENGYLETKYFAKAVNVKSGQPLC